MQHKTERTLYLRKILGETIKTLREERNFSGNKFANEYDIGNGNLSRIENAVTDCKFITVWRIAEALSLNFDDFAKILCEKLGDDFKLMDE